MLILSLFSLQAGLTFCYKHRSFLFRSTTAKSPYTLIHRMKEETNRMKQSLQKENTAALEKLARLVDVLKYSQGNYC